MSHQVIGAMSVADMQAVSSAESAAVAAHRILRGGRGRLRRRGRPHWPKPAPGPEVRCASWPPETKGWHGAGDGWSGRWRTVYARGRSPATAVLDRVSFVTELGHLTDRQLVLEAVPEDEATKLESFRFLDQVVEDPEAILASNTSSIPIAKLGRATERPGRVVRAHFSTRSRCYRS